MRFILSMTAVFAFGLSVLTACQNAAPPLKTNAIKTNSAANNGGQGQTDDTPRITLDDAKKDFDDGKAIFVDTRAEISYQQEHVKGAINVPAEAMATRYKEIPTDKKIIAYCS